MPETIFGVFTNVHRGFPGSIRSGLYPTAKSRPAVRPLPASSSGTSSSSVVPG